METPDSNTKGRVQVKKSIEFQRFGRGSIIRECARPWGGSACCGAGSNGGSGAALKNIKK